MPAFIHSLKGEYKTSYLAELSGERNKGVCLDTVLRTQPGTWFILHKHLLNKFKF